MIKPPKGIPNRGDLYVANATMVASRIGTGWGRSGRIDIAAAMAIRVKMKVSIFSRGVSA